MEAATQPFTVDGVSYPAGTYVVWMDQAKRSLANTFLEDGKNLSDVTGITFYSPPAVCGAIRCCGAAVGRSSRATWTSPPTR